MLVCDISSESQAVIQRYLEIKKYIKIGTQLISNVYFLFLRAIVLHATMKCTPMLQPLREGPELYQLLSVMEKKPKECQNLFVIGDAAKVE